MITAGLPGFRGLEHVAVAVPDLDAATEFFERVLGWPTVFTAGPYHDPDGDGMERHFGLHRQAYLRQLAVVRSPLVNFELLEGTAPDQATDWPRVLDIGGLHLALYVDDIETAHDYLVDQGCSSLGGIKPLGGPETGEGAAFGHVRTPIGLYLELITYPQGRDYESTAPVHAFNPSRPDAHARTAVLGEQDQPA